MQFIDKDDDTQGKWVTHVAVSLFLIEDMDAMIGRGIARI